MDYDSDVPRKITEVLVRKVPDNQQVSTYPALPFTPMLPEREGPVVAAPSWPAGRGVPSLPFGPQGAALSLTQPSVEGGKG